MDTALFIGSVDEWKISSRLGCRVEKRFKTSKLLGAVLFSWVAVAVSLTKR